MKDQARTLRVLISLVGSMTIGALVLVALDTNSLSGGAFSLASYTNLNPVEQVAAGPITMAPRDWNRIEVYYRQTDTQDAELLATLNGQDVNCHFTVCNGAAGTDGFIESTEKWQKQRPCLPGGQWYGSSQTIRIRIMVSGLRGTPTDCQIKRTGALVETLSRRLNIYPKQIRYPLNWQL